MVIYKVNKVPNEIDYCRCISAVSVVRVQLVTTEWQVIPRGIIPRNQFSSVIVAETSQRSEVSPNIRILAPTTHKIN